MTEVDGRRRRPRSDAIFNRGRILKAAADLVMTHGTSVPLEDIARAAGLGIATLYRHFPNRMVLLRQVAVDLLTQSAEEARATLAEETDAFTALTRYMHNAIDLRVGAAMPVLAELTRAGAWDEEVLAARTASVTANNALVSAAHREGSLRPDVSAGDIGMLIVRFTPLLPGALPSEANHQLSHRHLELLVDGLLRFLAVEELPGPTISLDELTAIPTASAVGVGSAGRSRTSDS